MPEIVMGAESGHKRIQKALETSDFLNGGRLNPMQEKKYQQYIRTTTDFMANADIRFTDRLQGKIDKLYMKDRVLEAASEATTFTNVVEPSFGKEDYNLVKFRGGFEVSYEFMLENIETDGIKSTLMDLFLKQAASDLSDVMVNGDTSSGDPFYAALDGFRVQSGNGNIFDAEGSEIKRPLFYAAYRTMPAQYRRRKNDMRWYMNNVLKLDWEETLGYRADSLGVNAFAGRVEAPAGISILTCDEIPSDLSVATAAATPAMATGTVSDPFTIAATNNALTIAITIDGVVGADRALTLTAGVYTAQTMAAAFNAQLLALGEPEIFGTDGWGHIVIKTKKAGATQAWETKVVANSIYTTIGITAALRTGSAAGANTITEGTYLWLTRPDNFRVYVHNQFRSYWKYVEESDTYKFIIYQFAEPILMNEAGIVTVTNVKLKDYL